jgi:DNA polymerase V
MDECFQDIAGVLNNRNEYGLKTRSQVLIWSGIFILVGIALTKSLSKVAIKTAKKFTERTGGSYVIDSE